MMIKNLGQNIIEYVFLLVAVITILIVTLGPEGMFTRKMDESLNVAIQAVKAEAARP